MVRKSENACRHTFHAIVELRSNIKKKIVTNYYTNKALKQEV
jgi:hypothetical protein